MEKIDQRGGGEKAKYRVYGPDDKGIRSWC